MSVQGIEIEGLTETLKALQGVQADLRRQANSALRSAAGECARALVGLLQAAAAASGVPVAPLVARTAKVKSDRLPAVQIGGARKVGRRGAPASALLWGSEHGPAGDPNHFAVPANAGGYWIAPTVERFTQTGAVAAYQRAVFTILHAQGLL